MEKYFDSTLSAEERAIALTDAMTVEEQASQLRYDAPAVKRLGIPAYNWWNEGLHGLARSGIATMFPQAIGLAAMFDTELTQKVADITAEEARAKYNAYTKYDDRDIYKGLTFWAPNINIFRDPRWGRGHETYGEDPYLTAENGKAFVNGLQGEGKTMKAAACAKHYAVHSGPEAVRHEFNAEVSKKDIEETYLPAFEALVREAHVEGVMGAYNRVNGEAACASSFLMSKLNEWGFDGYFVSDCWAIRDFHEHHGLTANPVESAALAIKSGCDEGESESGFFESEELQERFFRLWEEIAKRFGKYHDCVAFELLNEVTNKEYCDIWNEIADKCIFRIRTIAPETYILIGGYDNNCIKALKDLKQPYDNKIVYNFHCYEPFIFTHQGANWVNNMPENFRTEYPASVQEYITKQSKMNLNVVDLISDAKVETVGEEFFESLFSEAVEIAEKRNVPLYCGEYGVINLADQESTIEWYKAINSAFKKYKISRAAWCYKKMDFGLIDNNIAEKIKKYL